MRKVVMLGLGMLVLAGLLVNSSQAQSTTFDWRVPARRPVRTMRAEFGGRDFGEFLVDTSLVCAPGQGSAAAAAWGAGQWLVVWQGNSSVPEGVVLAARVSADGQVIDTAVISICTPAAGPAVAYDGANFLVVWMDFRNGPMPDIYGARVSPAGAVLDPGGFPISTAFDGQDHVTVAAGTSGWFVAWCDYRNAGGPTFADIYGARVSASGQVLDPDGIPVSQGDQSQYVPEAAFDGTNWLVVWEDYRSGWREVYGARVSSAGAVLDPSGIAVSYPGLYPAYPAVAARNGEFLVVWTQVDTTSFLYRIHGARLAASGSVLDSTGIALTMEGSSYEWPAGVAWSYPNYIVAWTETDSVGMPAIAATRVTEQGVPLDSLGLRLTSDDPYWRAEPAVAAGALVVWSEGNSIAACRLNPDQGIVLDSGGFSVPFGANIQGISCAAFDGERFLVAFEDYRDDDGGDLYGVILDAAGNQAGPSFPIMARPGTQMTGGVAFDGTNYLVVWEEQATMAEVWGARVTPEGVVLDTAGLRLFWSDTTYCSFPSVAFGDTCYLVTWTEYGSYLPNVKVGRVSRNGQVLDPLGTYVKKDSLPRAYSTVAFDGENWFVTWTDGHDFEYPEIYGTRVSQDGLILDTATIEVSAEPDYQMFPATAFDGTDYWAAWIDVRTGDTLVYAARVSPAGTVLDPDGIEAGGPVSTDWVWGVRPVVAEFDGTDCQLAWAQFGSIAGARLRPDGTVRDTFTTIRSSAACYPTLACGDEMLLTWTDWAGEVNGRTYNTARVWGKFGPFPGIKEGRGTPNAESRTLTATPNPSRGGVLIRCAGSFAGHVRVAISDASGRVVRRLATTDVEHGAQNVVWDGSDERGQRLPSGVYLIRVEGNGPSATYVVLIVR